MPKIDFVPSRDGFHFGNEFTNEIIRGIKTRGRCGGMALAALDYYTHRLPIPTHTPVDFGEGVVPPNPSRLGDYIYQRLMHSFAPDKVWRFMTLDTNHDHHYEWSVRDEFPVIKARIDAGRPVVLGLRARESNLAAAHQVVAYGYEENPARVYVYDCNHRNEEVVLFADAATKRIVHKYANGHETQDAASYASYFVHDVFNPDVIPPYVDLGLQQGITLQPGHGPLPVGGRLVVEAVVKNFGDYPAHVKQLLLYVRGPRGENLDRLLGGDGDNRPFAPGEERTIRKTCERFGDVPGSYRIGLCYLSQQNHWLPIPQTAPGTRQELSVGVEKLLAVTVSPDPVPLNEAVPVTVTARDAATQAHVNGTVFIDDRKVGSTGVAFTHTFKRRTVRVFDPETRRWTVEQVEPTGRVTAPPQYAESLFNFNFE